MYSWFYIQNSSLCFCSKQLRKIGDSAEEKKKIEQTESPFRVGQTVEYLSRTRGDWHIATVKSVRADGSCLVKLHAGAVKIAAPAMLRAKRKKGAKETKAMDVAEESSSKVKKEKKKNSPVGECIVSLLRALGFEEDESTGFWLLLPRRRVGILKKLQPELAILRKSPSDYLATHTTVQPKKEEEENDDEEDVLPGPTTLRRQVFTRRVVAYLRTNFTLYSCQLNPSALTHSRTH